MSDVAMPPDGALLVLATKSRFLERVRKEKLHADIVSIDHNCECGYEIRCVRAMIGREEDVGAIFVHACLNPRCKRYISTADAEEVELYDLCPLCDELAQQALDDAFC